jgi:tape measure domain-containing protein
MSDQTIVGLKAVMDLGNMVANSRTYIDKINEMTNATAKYVAESIKNFSTASKGASSFEKLMTKVKSVTYGVLIADVFKAIGKELKNAASEALGAVVAFQSLRIQMDTIVARDYAKSMGVSIPEALEKTSGASKELLQWVRQIAVTSPFSSETLGRVLAMSQAYGFSSTSAKRLIFDVGELASAWGLEDSNIQSIIYNFGQMVTTGKVTGYTLRNLARDMVPVSDMIGIIAEKYGKSKLEITNMFKSGEISVKEFIETFETLVEKDYPGAMERMSRTFTGAFSNIKDLLQSMVGYEILGPLADQIAGMIQDAVTSFLTPENYQLAANLGQVLLYSFDRLSDGLKTNVIPRVRELFGLFSAGEQGSLGLARGIFTVVAWINQLNSSLGSGISNLSKFVNNLFSYFGGSFDSLTDRMETWGNNLVVAFANGMAKAIVAVLEVITSIGATISKYLKSNSPPLLLPDLEKWGTNAMLSYMKGWKEANFDTFTDIGSIISDMIQSWEGIIDEKTLIGNSIAAQVALSNLTQQFQELGEVSSASLTALANASGIASNELNQYIQTAFTLTKVQEISDAVGKMLDFTGVGSFSIFGQMVSSFDQISDMADKFGPDLANIIREYTVNSQQLIAIDQQIAKAQEEVNKSAEEYNLLLAELEARLNKITDRQEDISRIRVIDRTLSKTILTAYERERLELEKKQILTEREIRDAKAQKTSEDTRLNAVVEGYKAEKEALEAKLKAERDSIQAISDANVSSLENQLKVIKDLIESQIKLNELYSRMVNIKVKTEGEEIDTSEFEDLLGDSLTASIDTVLESIDFKNSLDELWNSVQQSVLEKWSAFTSLFEPVKTAWETLKSTWKGLFSDPEFQATWDIFTTNIKTGLDILSDFWKKDGPGITKGFGELLGVIVTNLMVSNEATGKSVLEIISESFISIAEVVAANGDQIKLVLKAISDFMNDKAFPAFKEALALFGQVVIPAIIDFTLKAIPPLLDLLGYMVEHWKTIVLVLGAFQVLGVLKGGGQSILGSAMKGLGFILGGITVLKFLSGGAAGGGILSLLGLGGATATGAAAATGTAAIPAEIKALVATLNKAFAPQTAAAGGSTFGSIATGITGGALAFFGGAWLVELIRQEITGEKGLIITTIENWGEQLRTAWAGSWFETSINTVFGEEGWMGQFNTWISDTATGISDWANSIFGDDESKSVKGGKMVAPPFRFDLDGWLDRTFGPESTFMTSLNTFFDDTFGETGSISTIINGLFGEGGTLSGDSISSWVTRTFGEDSTFQTSIKTGVDSVFGPSGTINNTYNFLFGEGGILTDQAIIGWITRTFGKDSKFQTGISNFWNSIFGKTGFFATTWNQIFGTEGILSIGSISSWLTNTFGSKSTFYTKAITLWNGIFGKEGAFKTIFSNLFGVNGVFSGENITTSINNIFGSKGTLATSITNAFSGIDLNPFRNAGRNIVQGIGWGIGQEEWPLYYQVTNLARNITTWFNSVLGIHSKSRVFEQSGWNIGLGLAEGILSSIPMIEDAMSSLMSAPLYTSSSITNNDNRIFIDMNPSYENYSSPSDVYHDTVAALSAIGR